MLRQEKLSIVSQVLVILEDYMKCLNRKEDAIPLLQKGNNQDIGGKEKSNMSNMFFSLCWNSSEPPLFEADDVTYCENFHNNFFSLDDLLTLTNKYYTVVIN